MPVVEFPPSRPRGHLEFRSCRLMVADVVMGGLIVLGGTLIAFFGRAWLFFYDDWSAILYRRSGGLSAFFAPHDGHLQAGQIAVYRLWFAVVGLRTYHPYQATLIASHLVLCSLVYLYAKRRVGEWPAVAVTLPIIFLAYAWQAIFWAPGLGFTVPLVAFLVMLLWRRPVVVAAALGVALATFGVGVAVAVGAFVLAVGSADRARQLTAWGIPVAAYAVWWFAYRPSALPPRSLRKIPGADPRGDVGSISFPRGNIGRIPGFVARSAHSASGALTATGNTGGWIALASIGAVVVGALLFRRRLSVAFLAIAATLVAFWVLTALARSQFEAPEASGASRYLYPGAVLLALLVVEAIGRVEIPRSLSGRLFVAVGAVALLAALAQDVHLMRATSAASRTRFAQEAQLLHRAECDPTLPAGYELDPLQAPGVMAGPYLAAVRALGSPPSSRCPVAP